MSEYVFLVGDDYESNNKEYVSIDTDKGKLISIALTASGIGSSANFRKTFLIISTRYAIILSKVYQRR